MIEFEKGSTNVYADLGFPDAEEMFRKAQLTSEIDKIIKTRRWSRRKAAEVGDSTARAIGDVARPLSRHRRNEIADCLRG